MAASEEASATGSRSMSRSRTSQRASTEPANESAAPRIRISFRPCRKPCWAALRTTSCDPCGTPVQRLAELAGGSGLDQSAGLPAADRSAGDLLRLRRSDAQEDRSPGGDADGDADLAERVVDPGGHAASLLRDDAQGDVGDHRVQQPHADSAHHEPGEQRGPGRVQVQAGHQRKPDTGQGEAPGHQVARLDPGQRHPGHRRHDERGDGYRQVAQPCIDRRVPEEVLQVQRQIQEQREHRARDGERGELHARERRPLEQLERQHRLRHPALDHDEGDQEHGRARDQRDDQRAAPALVVSSHEGEHQEEQRGRERGDPGPVHPGRVRIARLGHLPEGDRDGGDADRDVDQEDRLPSPARPSAGRRRAGRWRRRCRSSRRRCPWPSRAHGRPGTPARRARARRRT